MIPGWPSCAKQGCMWPAVFKVEMENDAGPFWTHLCLFCVIEIKQCLAELSALGDAEMKLLRQEEIKPEEIPLQALPGPEEGS